MKIYSKSVVFCENITEYAIAQDIASRMEGLSVKTIRNNLGEAPHYNVMQRGEFLREEHIDGKALLKLMPAWAKVKKPKSIGHIVAAFYAENNKVVCDTSALEVGSDEWLINQDDPHRAGHYHLFRKYNMYAEEFDCLSRADTRNLNYLCQGNQMVS